MRSAYVLSFYSSLRPSCAYNAPETSESIISNKHGFVWHMKALSLAQLFKVDHKCKKWKIQYWTCNGFFGIVHYLMNIWASEMREPPFVFGMYDLRALGTICASSICIKRPLFHQRLLFYTHFEGYQFSDWLKLNNEKPFWNLYFINNMCFVRSKKKWLKESSAIMILSLRTEKLRSIEIIFFSMKMGSSNSELVNSIAYTHMFSSVLLRNEVFDVVFFIVVMFFYSSLMTTSKAFTIARFVLML